MNQSSKFRMLFLFLTLHMVFQHQEFLVVEHRHTQARCNSMVDTQQNCIHVSKMGNTPRGYGMENI